MDEKREDAVFLQKAGQLLTQFWEKLKEIWDSPKRYQLLLVIGAVGIGMIFCSELGEKPSEQKETTADSGEMISLCQEDGEYLAATEQRLEEMIEQIDGAGKCSVMITLKQGSQNIYASEQKIVRDQSKDQLQDNQVRTQEQNSTEQALVVVEDKDGGSFPVIERTIQPQVNGVVVVCEGGKSSKVCQQVTEAVTTVPGLRSTDVCVLPKDR